jgi:hypothetical protein
MLFEESPQRLCLRACITCNKKKPKMALSRYLRDEMDTEFIEEAVERNDVDDSYGVVVDQLLYEEYKRFNESEEDNEEEHIVSSIRRRMKNATDERADRNYALAALMWRLRQQSVAFEAFMVLYDEGFMSLAGLQYDVIFDHEDETVRGLCNALSRSFEFGRKLQHPPLSANCLYYAVPMLWFGTMLVRGALVPLESIVDFLAGNGTFGTFDADTFSKCWPEGKEFEINPIAQARIPSHSQGLIGLHLPRGMDFPCKLEDVYYQIDEPLRRYEEVFARYFKIPEQVYIPAGRIWMP